MRANDPLRSLKVASPCRASWDAMVGDERVRFCGQCRLNVYNLSGMRREEAERLLASTEGRLCVRYYRRKDGTVLTRDCPVGLAAMRRRVASVASAIAGFALGVLTGGGATLALREDADAGVVERTMGVIAERPPVKPDFVEVQGTVPPRVTEVVGRLPDASHPKRLPRAGAR